MAEVAAMAQGHRDRQKSDWQRTAHIVAMVHNSTMGRKNVIPAERMFPFAFDEEVYFSELKPDKPRRTFDQVARWHREVFKKQNLN